MIFLPIVERELRVSARKKVTHWSRIGSALLALIITGCLLLIIELAPGGVFQNQGGLFLYSALSWLTFAGVCLAGIFLTADSVSEEKREGTLGLLFLTDLRGYDVILGKLLATSLQAFYAVLAVFPFLALPLLMGGVTAAQFWKAMMALLNTLFFSLAAGIFVSSVQRDAQHTMKFTFLLLAVFIGLLPMLDSMIPQFTGTFGLFTPSTAFFQASSRGSGTTSIFWTPLLVSHLIGWIFLVVAALITPKAWHEKASAEKTSLAHRWKFGSAKFRSKFRAHWLEQDPVVWLALRERWQGIFFQSLFLITLTLFVISLLKSGSSAAMALNWSFSRFIHLLIEIWIATQASRLFVDARNNGALELLLCTPLPEKEIVRGQFRALLRTFAVPVLLVALLQIAVLIAQLSPQSATTTVTRGATVVSGPNDYLIIQTISGLITFLAGTLALIWFGMWCGLTSRKPAAAALKAFAFVRLLPSLATSIAGIFFMMILGFWSARSGSSFFSGMDWLLWQSICTTALSVVINVAFIAIARRGLYLHLRAIAAGENLTALRRAGLRPESPTDSPPVI